jgi:hypothetical protein
MLYNGTGGMGAGTCDDMSTTLPYLQFNSHHSLAVFLTAAGGFLFL